jgi:hypothetical protein
MSQDERALTARDREAYGWKLDAISSAQHEKIAARRADLARLADRNSPEKLWESVYKMPPYDEAQ